MKSRSFWGIAAAAAMCFVVAGCNDGETFRPKGGAFYQPPTIPTEQPPCTPARSSEPLVPRVDLTGMSASTVGGQDVAYTSDLFGQFYAFCGGCHVDGAQGDRHIGKSIDAFAAGFDQSWLDAIMSDDPNKWMPRPGQAFTSRKAGDPVVDFAKHLQAWLSVGRPKGMYALGPGDAGGSATATANYTFTSSVAAAMTNIGNCVPTSALFASSTSDVMTSMDEFFKNATELPKTLAETDLTSLDSEELAKTAVIAYAPTYALWSAGSGKLRHVRVPRGQSVKFDKATQTFDIPDNTRFYKTFLRKVKDRTGATTYRKMETRVIVARADDINPATGAARQNGLFGTYIWSEDETTATFASQPYRDQDPKKWGDIVRSYITDELLYQDILDSSTGTVDGAVALAIKNNANNPAYRDLVQHYAIPGTFRCIQCHMGSPTKDFVLGFNPLQINRRATGTGGTYDVTGADELSQLQRMIDVGVITGITSLDDVKLLEDSEGARKPRKTASAAGDQLTDDGELKAQAYMVGNCAHCHNPRGFPSITKPELASVLNFLPNDKDGGIFEFPLERVSPVRTRGAFGDIPMPYITPSLRDYPVGDGTNRIDTGKTLISGENGAITYTPKFFAGDAAKSCADPDLSPDFRAYCGDRKTGSTFVAAPWRSLLYRNVETPASYFDDYVPFPHMPLHTAGFDCRAPRIMGDWMAGLPSIRKMEYIAKPLAFLGVTAPSEDALPGSASDGVDSRAPVLGSLTTGYDDNPQPYIEVRPDSDLYQQALVDARARLTEYHEGVRYQYCQDVLSPDIFDPFEPQNKTYPYPYHPNPYEYQLSYIEDPPFDPMHADRFVQPRIGVPFHAHWISYDPTESPGDWVPRRTEWKDILVDNVPDTQVPVGTPPLDELKVSDPEAAAKLQHGRELLLAALHQAQFPRELFDYATTDKPYGLWQVKPECEQKLGAPGVKKVSDFAGSARPAWMDVVKPANNAAVYMMSPGAAIYRHVCINCHGPNADGHGLQADLLAGTSEGEARPANFRLGLFGPPEHPLANAIRTFDITQSGDETTATLWGSRYMAWMALGGTLKRIPQDILQLVAATPILGNRRDHLADLPGSTDATGNMLNLAKAFCSMILPEPDQGLYAFASNSNLDSPTYPPYDHAGSPLLSNSYDKEMWVHLCTDFSPPIVRVYGVYNGPNAQGKLPPIRLLEMYYAYDPADPARSPGNSANFPANAPVWDNKKTVQTDLAAANTYPACLDPDKIPAATVATLPIPACPAAFLANGKVLWRDQGVAKPSDNQQTFADNIQTWKLRGGIATGMAVFSYMDLRVKTPSMSQLPLYYNQCDLLP